jgi:hypothetical protein
VDNKYRKFGGVAFHIMKNNRTGKEWTVCNECMHCQHCKSKTFDIFTNEDNNIWKPNIWLCKYCADNATPREEHKKSKGDNKTCKECQKTIDQIKQNYKDKKWLGEVVNEIEKTCLEIDIKYKDSGLPFTAIERMHEQNGKGHITSGKCSKCQEWHTKL